MNESVDPLIANVRDTLRTFPARPAGAVDQILSAVREPQEGPDRELGAGRVAGASGARRKALGLLLAAGVGGVLLLGISRERATPPMSIVTEPVQFVYVDGEASGVAVVGSFNAWDPTASPLTRGPDGIWTLEAPVLEGRHLFAFVVDGEWKVDARAPQAPENEFGLPSSVLVVGGP